jgi:hypothetical protein
MLQMNSTEDDILIALKLQQEELENARKNTFGKCGVHSDASLALQLMMEFSTAALVEFTDEQFAKSVDRAITSDQELIQALENCRIQEEADNVYAKSLAVSCP